MDPWSSHTSNAGAAKCMLRWETTHAKFQDILGPSKQVKYVAFSKLDGSSLQRKFFAAFYFVFMCKISIIYVIIIVDYFFVFGIFQLYIHTKYHFTPKIVFLDTDSILREKKTMVAQHILCVNVNFTRCIISRNYSLFSRKRNPIIYLS